MLQQVKAELTAIGKEGEKAFSGIEKSATSASGGVAKVGEAAGKASGGVASVGKAARPKRPVRFCGLADSRPLPLAASLGLELPW